MRAPQLATRLGTLPGVKCMTALEIAASRLDVPMLAQTQALYRLGARLGVVGEQRRQVLSAPLPEPTW